MAPSSPPKGTRQEAPDAGVRPKPDGVMNIGADTNKRVARSWQRAAMKANPNLDSAKLSNIAEKRGKKDQGKDHAAVSMIDLAREYNETLLTAHVRAST